MAIQIIIKYSFLDILIDESLVLHQEHQVAEYFNYLDESMSFEDQGLNATFWPIQSWDAFELARAGKWDEKRCMKGKMLSVESCRAVQIHYDSNIHYMIV